MKINYLGHQGLLSAIESLLAQSKVQCTLYALDSFDTYPRGHFDLLITDSQYVKTYILPNMANIHSEVLVLGHYTDDSAKDAFCINEQFSYISYSQLECLLPDFIKARQIVNRHSCH